MNYELFYKMIKEAQTGTSPSPPKAPTAPTAPAGPPANSRPTSSTPPQSTPVTPSNTYTPSPAISSGDVYDLVKNTPVPDMNPVPTAEQLANRWIQEKEDFYHNKADKYPQYANWHVSNQTRAHLMQQAQDMIKEHPEEAARIWAQQQYNPASPTSVYRDEAFQYANRGNKDYVDKRNGKIQGGAAGQNASMRNPVAPAAIGNPVNAGSMLPSASEQQSEPTQQDISMHTPRVGAIIQKFGLPAYAQTFEDMQRFSEAWIKQYGYHPDSMSPAAREYREAMNQYGSKLYPYYPGMTSFSQYAQDAANNQSSIYGGAQERINQIDNAYIDSRFFPQFSYGPRWGQALQNYIAHKNNPWDQKSYF